MAWVVFDVVLGCGPGTGPGISPENGPMNVHGWMQVNEPSSGSWPGSGHKDESGPQSGSGYGSAF